MAFNIQVPSFKGEEVRDFLYTKYNEYLRSDEESVCIDLSQIPILMSNSLGALAKLIQKANKKGGKAYIYAPDDTTMETLTMIQFNLIAQIFRDKEDFQNACLGKTMIKEEQDTSIRDFSSDDIKKNIDKTNNKENTLLKFIRNPLIVGASLLIIYLSIAAVFIIQTESNQIAVLGTLFIGLIAWFYGKKSGNIFAFSMFVLNCFMFNLIFSNQSQNMLSETILGGLVMFATAIIVGFVHDLVNRLRFEINYRKKIEAELTEYKNHLEDLVKKRTEELEKAHLQLRQSEKMEALGQLVGGIAHDFNNMLGGIVGYADLIKRKFLNDPLKVEKYSGLIITTSNQTSDLIKKLLIFSRTGKFELREVDIHEIISNTVKLLSHSIPKTIKIELDLNAPSSVVMGDSSQLSNIFLNLGINARDAMPNGGSLKFSTELFTVNKSFLRTHPNKFRIGDYLLISVADTGTGIEEKIQKKIFDPFFTTKEVGKGTGLGLASTYGAIKEHKGVIDVYSVVDEGTTFRIYLPFAHETAAEEPETQIIHATGSIVLIDDDDTMRIVASEMLEDIGFSVKTFKNSKEGLEYYARNQDLVDMVMVDLIMPDPNGTSCFTKIREINSQSKIIITSGQFVQEKMRDILDTGNIKFIQKPFDTRKLSKTIQEFELNN
ncbi:MAG: response regulator [Chitinispirillia bacterium]|jgi:signal transduction histidine kinase/CheY-like chemotaxis protein/anti-anti-sigma regulatory factor